MFLSACCFKSCSCQEEGEIDLILIADIAIVIANSDSNIARTARKDKTMIIV